ncbi:MAG: serine protease [Firmicutes bacterium]|nr:serine protease [Bacillota bacterium]
MDPKGFTEYLMYSTALIETKSGRGTGFFFAFEKNDKTYPILVTNQHVLNYNSQETVNLKIHIIDENTIRSNLEIEFKTEWIFHPNQDLAFCFVNPFFETIKQRFNKEVFYVPIQQNFIYSDDMLRELSAVEETIMAGYPIGLSDEHNNYPIFRKGITASHPALDFNNTNVGLVDMACFPGSSGSPIFIINENGYSDKNGNHYLGRKRIIFLGILYSGPIMNASGKIEVREIPTVHEAYSNTQIMINLGYYIKAEELLNLLEKTIK